MKIGKVCILGAGTLGSRVALQAALSGYQVNVYDIKQEALDSSVKVMQKILRQLIKLNRVQDQSALEIIHKITFTIDPMEAVYDADIINESVLEEVATKEKVWGRFL